MEDCKCAICLDCMSESTECNLTLIKLNCSHHFHDFCLKQIYRHNCPLCNAEIHEPLDVVDSISKNIERKQLEQVNAEAEVYGALEKFITCVFIFIANNERNKFPIYYRYQRSWSISQHIINYGLCCSDLYHQDETENITWSYDLDTVRTVCEYDDNGDLIFTVQYKISDFIEQVTNINFLFNLLSNTSDSD